MRIVMLLVVALVAASCSTDEILVPPGADVIPHRLIAEDLDEGDERPLTSFVTSVDVLPDTAAFDQVLETGGGEVCTADDSAHRIIVALKLSDLPDDALIFEF